MYKCHMCDLQTSQLNSLMARHYKKHCSENYSKEKYKADVLAVNGRKLNNCLICNIEVPIPKGEKDSPTMHKACYVGVLKNKTGNTNANYSGGLIEVKCGSCQKELYKHRSHLKRDIKFCSISCSMNFYAKEENRTDAQKANDIQCAEMLRSQNGTDKQRINHAKALAKLQLDGSSNLEKEVLAILVKKYPLAKSQVVKDFYTVDIYIPEIDTYLDIHGNYWHNSPGHQSGNNRKRNFFKNKNVKYLEIWGNELSTPNILDWANKSTTVTILCGPSGCGKSWLANELSGNFNIVDYDKLRYEKSIEIAAVTDNCILVTPIRASKIRKVLQDKGVRARIVVIKEHEAIISYRLSLRDSAITDGIKSRIKRYNTVAAKESQFHGTQKEVMDFLLKK